MGKWTRSTAWRQGSVIDQQAIAATIGPDVAGNENPAIGIVISHHCDLAADPLIEPSAEVIRAVLLEREDGSLTQAKNSRRLHLRMFDSIAGKPVFAELKARDRHQLPKEALVDQVPSTRFTMSSIDLEILRRWLASRYRRHAFPDAFEERFSKVEAQLREILKKSSDHIRAVLFDLDEDLEAPDEPYVLDIYLVYVSGGNSLQTAEAVRAKTEGIFRSKYRSSDEWVGIELRSCEVISDEALTYSQYLHLAEWRAEDLSLRSDPIGPMMDENNC